MIRRWILRGLAVAVLALLAFSGKLIVDAGAFRTIQPHFAGSTKTIRNIVGSEDLEYSPAQRYLFISSDSRPERPGEPTPGGAVFGWALADASSQPTNLTTGWRPGFEFHPHGMAFWDLPGRTRLWVINHRKDETSVEVFAYEGGKLTFERSLRDPLLATANDLVAFDERRFYVTSDHGSASHAAGKLEDYTRQGRGYVSLFDGKGFSVKADRIQYANGIVLSAPPSDPKAKVLVASMLGKRIRIFDRDPATNDLTPSGEVPLDGGPDNITRDEEGAIWVGAHPKLFALKAMSDDRRKRAPALILKVTGIASGTPMVEEIMQDDGSTIAAASVALRLGDRLILGSVFDDRLLDCRLP